jgi:hypothetical protein
MNVRRTLAGLCLAFTLAPAVARAQVSDADKATARDLTIEGFGALDKRDFATAADRFKRADSLYHAPTIALGLARAYVGLGKLLAAQEAYNRVAHETVPPNAPAAFANAVADAQRELAALTPRVPAVIINVKGPTEPRVTLDGVDVPNAALGVKRPVDPGQHVIKVTAAGFAPSEATFTAAEGKVEGVTVEPKPGAALPPTTPPPTTAPPGPKAPPATPPPPITPPPPATPDRAASTGSPQKTIGFIGLGLGAAGLVAGGVTGGLALSKHASLLKTCLDGHCPKGSEMTNQAAVDSYKTMGTISTIGFIAGGALAATGIVLVVTAPKAKPTATLTPVIGLGYLGAEGSF